MKSKHKNSKAKPEYEIATVSYRALFPRPICLEKCTMNMPNGYEKDILKTLKAFSNEDLYNQKSPHKLIDKNDLWSLDVKSRNDKYRLLYRLDKDTKIYKIIDLCTTETH